MREFDPNGELSNERSSLIRGILLDAFKRSQEMEKMMTDPMDVLTFLLDDLLVKEELVGIGIDINKVRVEMDKVESQTPQGADAKAMMEFFGLDEGPYLSFVLMQSKEVAGRLADEEGAFWVTGQHLLAGMLRQGNNSGFVVFREVGITQEQYATLARVR